MRRIFIGLTRMYQLQKTRRELQALSDHLLRDIGLRRDQIAFFSEVSRRQSSS